MPQRLNFWKSPLLSFNYFNVASEKVSRNYQRMIRVVLWTDEEFIVPVTYHDRWSVGTLLRAIDLPNTESDNDYLFFFEGKRLDNRTPFPAKVTRQKESIISVVPRKWLRERHQQPARYESVQCMSALPGRELPEIPVPENVRKFSEKLDSDLRQSEDQTRGTPAPRMDGTAGHRLGFDYMWSSDDEVISDVDDYIGIHPMLFGAGLGNMRALGGPDEFLYDDMDMEEWDDMDDEDMSEEDALDEPPWDVEAGPPALMDVEARPPDPMPNLTVALEALRSQLTPEELEQVQGLCRDHHTSEFTALQVFLVCDKQVESAANVLRSMNAS